MQDSLGDRMKESYEDRTRMMLPRRSYTLIRVDGKAFHTYTKGLDRPFDVGLVEDMDATAAYLCKNIMGAKFALVQSDEISLLLTDFEEINTQAWFDNNLQKMCSVSASMATRAFNSFRLARHGFIKEFKWAEFDSRVFQIAQRTEVENYFIWRQKDTMRNSVSSVSQSMFSTKELHGKDTDKQKEMILSKGMDWEDFKPEYKYGRIITKENYDIEGGAMRTRWVSNPPPIFTQSRIFLDRLIPTNL